MRTFINNKCLSPHDRRFQEVNILLKSLPTQNSLAAFEVLLLNKDSHKLTRLSSVLVDYTVRLRYIEHANISMGRGRGRKEVKI